MCVCLSVCVAAVAVGALHAVGRRHPRGRAPALPHAGLRPGEWKRAAAAVAAAAVTAAVAAAAAAAYDDLYCLDNVKRLSFKKKLYCLYCKSLWLCFTSPTRNWPGSSTLLKSERPWNGVNLTTILTKSDNVPTP